MKITRSFIHKQNHSKWKAFRAPVMAFFIFLSLGLLVEKANAQIIIKYETVGSHTFTTPCLVTTAKVEAWGAGGRGGRRAPSSSGYLASGGGGGGAYTRADSYPLSASSYTVTVGAGGSNTTIDGGNSAFGSLTGNGGKGVADANGDGGWGSKLITSGGAGGAISSGGNITVSHSGGKGGDGSAAGIVVSRYGGGGGSSAGTSVNGNAGGSGSSNPGGTAPAGGGKGGNGADAGGSNPGAAGEYPGGGGGGSINGGSPGAGARGQVHVTLNFQSPTIIGANSYQAGEMLHLATTSSSCNRETYQWYRNGIRIEGATAPTLTIPNLTLADAGTYTVEMNIGTYSYNEATAVTGQSNGITANGKTISGVLASEKFEVTVTEPVMENDSDAICSKR